MFYIVNFLILFSSLVVVLSGNVIMSVFFLIIDFLLVAYIYIYIGATFLSFVIIMVYVGAVTVLFLFVVMMLDTRYIEYYKFKYGLRFCILISFFIFIIAYLLYFQDNLYLVDEDYLSTSMKLYNNFSNIVLIGSHLYNYYFIHVIVIGVLLFTGMVGIINILQKKSKFYYSYKKKKR